MQVVLCKRRGLILEDLTSGQQQTFYEARTKVDKSYDFAVQATEQKIYAYEMATSTGWSKPNNIFGMILQSPFEGVYKSFLDATTSYPVVTSDEIKVCREAMIKHTQDHKRFDELETKYKHLLKQLSCCESITVWWNSQFYMKSSVGKRSFERQLKWIERINQDRAALAENIRINNNKRLAMERGDSKDERSDDVVIDEAHEDTKAAIGALAVLGVLGLANYLSTKKFAVGGVSGTNSNHLHIS